jgi:hypothetical protein
VLIEACFGTNLWPDMIRVEKITAGRILPSGGKRMKRLNPACNAVILKKVKET